MKAIMLSIQPKWCELIASGKKTIEVRKSAPKLETPFKCYIYCTNVKNMPLSEYVEIHRSTRGMIDDWHGKVIGEFICDKIDEFHEWQLAPQGKYQEFEENDLQRFLTASCLSWEEVYAYRQNLPYYKPLFGWHISDLKIYDKPKELGEFKHELPRDKRYVKHPVFDNLTRPPQSWCYVEEMI